MNDNETTDFALDRFIKVIDRNNFVMLEISPFLFDTVAMLVCVHVYFVFNIMINQSKP